MKLTKLIPVSAMALSLVVFTSCRIENLAPDLEPYFKEITGTDSTSFMSALASVTSAEGSTTDFKDGFKSGYAAGFTEGAKMNRMAVTETPYAAPAPTFVPASAPAPMSVASMDPTPSAIPSWGYSSVASSTSEPESVPNYTKSSTPKSSSSSRSSGNTRSYRSSSRGCAGGS